MDDFLAVLGSILITTGLWMAWPPLGVVALGAQLLTAGLIIGLRKSRPRKPTQLNDGSA